VKLRLGSTMKEIVLQHFFEGHTTAKELSDDLEGTRQALEPAGFRSSANYRVVPMSHEFTVEAAHVARLVDAVASGALSLELLGDLLFCMEASDRFRWDTDTADGERVAEAVFWLGTPEVNYPLNARVLSKIRHYLIAGENTLESTDLAEDI
jgi:hypothetical protein